MAVDCRMVFGDYVSGTEHKSLIKSNLKGYIMTAMDERIAR